MAQIDPSIAMSFRPVQIESPINQMAAIAQLRGAQEASQMNALKLQEYQQQQQERNALSRIMSEPGVEFGSDTFMNRVLAEAPSMYEGIATRAANRENLLAQREAREAQTQERKQKLSKEQLQSSLAELASYTKVDDARSALEQKVAAGMLTREQADKYSMGLPATDEEMPAWQLRTMRGLLTPAEMLTELREQSKPTVVLSGGTLVSPTGKVLFTAPKAVTPTELVRNYEYAKTPEGGGFKGTLEQFKALSAPRTNITLAPQEKAFETELGKGQAEGIMKSKTAATDAADNIRTIRTAREIMKSGMITGAGADFLVNFNQALKTAGIDAGYADASANSQAFTANMANSVGKLIKQFGAGTGLSDADRKYAIEMAGGRVSLDAKAINRILDINERAARNVIARHNKDVKGIKTNIPLEVEAPEVSTTTPTATPPAKAIDYLRANPSMKGAFDAKYGAGAADRALKGK
jgi:hypothetical protein